MSVVSDMSEWHECMSDRHKILQVDHMKDSPRLVTVQVRWALCQGETPWWAFSWM